MPHKHKRKRGEDDESNFNIVPTVAAQSLPQREPTRDFLTSNKRCKPDSKVTRKLNADDTPKQFARLLAWQQQGKKIPSGLDDGNLRSTKKAKKPAKTPSYTDAVKTNEKKLSKNLSTTADESLPEPSEVQKTVAEAQAQAQTQLKIQPKERLSDFALRVNQALPLLSVPKRSTKNPNQDPASSDLTKSEKKATTKHNKRLQKLQAGWRADEERLRLKCEEEVLDHEETRDEDRQLWLAVEAAGGGKSGKGKKLKRRVKEEEADPWKVLERKRKETKMKSLQDVVEAPPVLTKIKNIFRQDRESNNNNMGNLVRTAKT